jgi:UDP-N-acetylmuramate dehydrogenase
MGGGSNVLIADRGFDGLVLQIGLTGIREVRNGHPDEVRLESGAGEDWDRFVDYCVGRDLAGVECLSGIPGFVGGTPVQNVGAYGQEVAEVIHEVRCFDREDLSFIILSNQDCQFSYRKSIFNSSKRDRYVVLSVLFALRRSGEASIRYRDLIEHFGGRAPSLAETRDAVLSIRRSKSMVIDTGDPNSKSAGSFFKNPIVEKERFDDLASRFDGIPSFAAGEKVKIPAAWLIENAGFMKGYVSGRAGISSKHTLALINRGDATAADILVLKDRIRQAVAEKFGIDLVPEPVFVGF